MPRPTSRLAIIGIGNKLRGDDAVGVEIIRSLQASSLQQANIIYVQADYAPENILGRICQFKPDVVLFIDSVAMNADAGTIRLIDNDDITGEAFSTHTLSIKLVVKYLKQILNCHILILGIQPTHCELGSNMSLPVQQSLESIVDYLSSELQVTSIHK